MRTLGQYAAIGAGGLSTMLFSSCYQSLVKGSDQCIFKIPGIQQVLRPATCFLGLNKVAA